MMWSDEKMKDTFYYLYSPQGEFLGKYRTEKGLLKMYNKIVKYNSFLWDYSLLIEFKPNHFKMKVFY